jgi:cell division GTPase FtsZ
VIVVLNEKLPEVMNDDVTQEQAFAHANDLLKNTVGGDLHATAATSSTSPASSTSTSTSKT